MTVRPRAAISALARARAWAAAVAPVVGDLSYAERLLHCTLADVLMHAIVGDEASGRRAVALGVDEAVVVIDAGQQRRAGLHRSSRARPNRVSAAWNAGCWLLRESRHQPASARSSAH